MSTFSTFLNAFWPAVPGAVSGFLAGWASTSFVAWRRRRAITKGLDCYETEEHKQTAHLRVHNASDHPMRNCWAYIAFDDYDASDVAPDEWIKQWNVHFRQGSSARLIDEQEDRLFWACKGHHPSVDILPGERQVLPVFRRVAENPAIAVFSEAGEWHNDRRGGPHARIFFRVDEGKPLTGYIKIVCEDIRAKIFRFRIERPLAARFPIKILPEDRPRKRTGAA